MLLLLIGIAYVKGMGSSWIIFFSIVRLPVLYGMFSSAGLGCVGLCLDE
jgi:hypothetical protein